MATITATAAGVTRTAALTVASRRHGVGAVHHRHIDHAHDLERARRDLVRSMFERREQNEVMHVYAGRRRIGHRQCAMKPHARKENPRNASGHDSDVLAEARGVDRA
ncbi:MAG: hypothetical protein DMF94_00515 [Acidobacteria bacterium]|nr:MAG: hypothetical protein DMF94_00515 [Acidobacteriota bacterium]